MGIVVAVWWGCSGKPSFLPCKEPACTALPQQALKRTIGAVQRLNRKECEELWLYFTAREDTVLTAVSCIVPAEMYVHWSACFTTRIYVKYFDYWPCSARYNNLESSLFFIESLDCIRVQWTMDLVVEQMQCGECMVVKLMVFTAFNYSACLHRLVDSLQNE